MTLEELRALDHDILVHFRDELCRVVVQGDDRYLLSNNDDYAGNCPDNMYDYAYGWWLCSYTKSDINQLYRNLIPAKRRPI